MTENEALQMRSYALNAVKELNSIAALPLNWEADENLRALRRGIGLSIWQIEVEILARLFNEFPAIDDLRNFDSSQSDKKD